MVPSPDSLRQALESALVENPDDLATHRAYADLLMEEGDPRGELIQVQLALEEAERSSGERQSFKAREAELWRTHQRSWLGERAADLFNLPDHGNDFLLARGWLDTVVLFELNRGSAEALAECPLALLLRDITFCFGDSDDTGYDVLADAPCLRNLRRFQLGEVMGGHAIATQVLPVLKRMPRLEDLRLYAHDVDTDGLFALPMPHLRTLIVNNLTHYPLQVLADNPSLSNLEHLSFWPHSLDFGDEPYINAEGFVALVRSPHLTSLRHLAVYLSDSGDEGVAALVESGLLKHLKVLDLWSGRITDAGAHLLAACPDVRNLERLRIAQNQLTEAGIEALLATGIVVEAESQYGEDEIANDEHLLQGDIE